MLRRTGFKRREYQRAPPSKPAMCRPGVRVATGADLTAAPRPPPPVRSETYLRLVAKLPCISCGHPGPSQAAHSNTGKGMAVKTSDLTCFPLCADRPGVRGCHTLLDSGGLFSKEVRQRKEADWAKRTQSLLIRSNVMPMALRTTLGA